MEERRNSMDGQANISRGGLHQRNIVDKSARHYSEVGHSRSVYENGHVPQPYSKPVSHKTSLVITVNREIFSVCLFYILLDYSF